MDQIYGWHNIQGKDAIVQAQSGMGKTAALVISVLQRLDRNDPNCQALILAPTRELAEQVSISISNWFHKNTLLIIFF